jgi:hypothetical protein
VSTGASSPAFSVTADGALETRTINKLLRFNKQKLDVKLDVKEDNNVYNHDQ